ncbi:MAG: gamma-glutamylcyclotransferase family protein, partial [Gammaproteobacteria bacterium]|nr:gamma-glutamylcyclotransferase family protein [Gammaproteobacteria bacterium]
MTPSEPVFTNSRGHAALPDHTDDPGLGEVLRKLNAGRASGGPAARRRAAEASIERRFGASRRLAVYGSLAPGGRNHRILAPLSGEWRQGVVRGRRYPANRSTKRSFPGLCLDDGAGFVPVHLLTCDSLESRWGRLDAFEGEEYLRLLCMV